MRHTRLSRGASDRSPALSFPPAGVRRRAAVPVVAAALWAVAACGAAGAGQSSGGGDGSPDGDAPTDEEAAVSDPSIAAAQAAQEALTPTVMALSGVVGTAVGLCAGAPCIKVFLAREDPDLRARLPETFRGFTVDAEVSGEFEARDESP